jgi:hypothetical protein
MLPSSVSALSIRTRTKVLIMRLLLNVIWVQRPALSETT